MHVLESILKDLAHWVALGAELGAVLLIAIGTIEALYRTVRAVLARTVSPGQRKAIWLRFAVWILLALEFALAADIARTVIAPTWQDIGQLAAIATIRTALNFFLERDIEKGERNGEPAPA
jgi:uncharacterized membrane protein